MKRRDLIIGTGAALLTAEQFAERPDPGYPEELVRGRIVPLMFSKPRHGEICGRTLRAASRAAERTSELASRCSF